MNYLELINKCLLELNYRQVNATAELIKNDHKKIMSVLNIVNKEICNIENWNFLLRKTRLNIPKNATEVINPIKGRILYLIIDKKKYNYSDKMDLFLTGKANVYTYSICNDKLLFSKSDKPRVADIIYYTSLCVEDNNGNEKADFSQETDTSIIPMPFAEQLLVYGTCLRVKANPSYIRFSYWMSMYKEALSNLKSRSGIDANDAPSIRLLRE